ncbi:3917_t:CDS:2, partial [Entrophospora sp. SA101]
ATSTSPDQLSDENRNLLLSITIILGSYYVPVEDVRRRIREIDSSDPEFPPFISEKLRKIADMPRPEKEIENKLNHNNEMLQTLAVEIENKLNRNNEQMLQTLLAEIKNLKK